MATPQQATSKDVLKLVKVLLVDPGSTTDLPSEDPIFQRLEVMGFIRTTLEQVAYKPTPTTVIQTTNDGVEARSWDDEKWLNVIRGWGFKD
jgi:hypothetical protein